MRSSTTTSRSKQIPKRLLVTVRNGKTGYRVANTMSGAVSAYERIRTRYPDAGGEDYLFLPDYPNRATASRIFQRQFNQLLDDTGLSTTRRPRRSAASTA